MSNYIKWYNHKATSSQQFAIKDGFVFNDDLSEQLDSATIVLNKQVKGLAFEPFDIVEIYINNSLFTTMLIDSVVATQIAFTTDLYDYTLTLMSNTKRLERVIIPNCSFTKPKGVEAITLAKAIEILLEDYSPKYLTQSNTYAQLFTLSSSAKTILENTKCPDIYIGRGTLRTAIDKVLSVINAICNVNAYNQIDFIDLNERKNAVDTSKLNYINDNQASTDYANNLDNVYTNVIGNLNKDSKNYTAITEYLGFRNSSAGVVSDQTGIVETNYPIYDIKSFKFCGKVYLRNLKCKATITYIDKNGNELWSSYDGNFPDSDYYFEVDITKSILEQQNFDILSYEDKRIFAYYARYSNSINGLLNYKFALFQEEYFTIKMAVARALVDGSINFPYKEANGSNFIKDCLKIAGVPDDRQANSGSFLITYVYYTSVIGPVIYTSEDIYDIGNHLTLCSSDANVFKDAMFKLEYYSQVDSVRAKSGKYLPEGDVSNEIVDNPSESYVDIDQQGKLFNQKCNRLGNRVKNIMGRYTQMSELPQLGDYIDNFVVIHREITIFDTFILLNATMTENFVNINYFTGINARKRSWQIVNSSEAFNKQIIDKYYCELSFSYKTGADIIDKFTSCVNLPYNLFVSPLTDYEIDPVKHLTVEGFYDNPLPNGTYEANQYYHYELELNSYITGNSLIFHSDFYDNYSAGIAISNPNATGGAAQKWLPYVDKYGRNYDNCWFLYTLIKNFDITGGQFTMPDIGSSQTDNISSLLTYSRLKPALSWTDVYKSKMLDEEIIFVPTSTNFLVNHKDSREKIGINIQFEFCSDTSDIVIGHKFVEYQSMVNTASIGKTYLWVSQDETYRYGDEKGKGEQKSVINVIDCQMVGTTSAVLKTITTATSVSLVGAKSLAICDASGNLILGINKIVDGKMPYVYLNMMKTRDRNKYLNKDLKSWVK